MIQQAFRKIESILESFVSSSDNPVNRRRHTSVDVSARQKTITDRAAFSPWSYRMPVSSRMSKRVLWPDWICTSDGRSFTIKPEGGRGRVTR